jgi:glyoxylase-like metal-dependent hydrolase (beta-lactamase superfamily II)
VRTRPLPGGALLLTSALWQVNAIALPLGDEPVLVDSPVLPEELEALPALLRDAGLEPRALVATHAHFDHVLAPTAFPDLPLHVGASTLAALGDETAQQLAESDAELYIDRARGLSPFRAEVLDDDRFEVVAADGHAADGIALFEPEAGILLAGDYLIEIEIPLISEAGSPEAYLATLDRLAPLVERAEVVVPGHGPALTRDRARELVDLDRRYVADLEGGPLRGPEDHRQHRLHADNLRKHQGK